MKLIFKIIIFLMIVNLYTLEVFALTIVTPQEEAEVYAGAKLQVIVKPAPGEKWEEVLLGIFPMSYNYFTNEYKEKIEIPEDVIGTIDFSVLAYDKSDKKVKLARKLFVKLAPNVVLQSIVAGSKVVSGSTLVLLRKMPDGSSLADIENYEKAELSINGKYSDGVERALTSSASGTTYTSSNENIATVSSEGKVTAQGLGTATITVRNGKYSATVKVVVKPYKP